MQDCLSSLFLHSEFHLEWRGLELQQCWRIGGIAEAENVGFKDLHYGLSSLPMIYAAWTFFSEEFLSLSFPGKPLCFGACSSLSEGQLFSGRRFSVGNTKWQLTR